MRLLLPLFAIAALSAADQVIPPGFTALFDGRSLEGWWGAGTEDPRKYLAMAPEDFARKREASLADIKAHWSVQDGELVNDGKGLYLTTVRNYRDFELVLEYKTVPKADSGIYLKGCPQVQIWDHTNEKEFKNGADKGSGGLWNNSPGKPGKDPLVLADRPFGEWNAVRVIQCGSRTWVWLNGKQVVDNAVMENYFARRLPLPPMGPIQLQTHGGEIRWRNIAIREIPSDEANKLLRGTDPDGFKVIFNGKDFAGWKGPIESYEIKDGTIMCRPGKGGTIHTVDEYADFVVRLEFRLPPGGNNGLAIRYPGTGDTAYQGMCEIQVLDDTAAKYAQLMPGQYHGSVYHIIPAYRDPLGTYLRPVGEWNYQEVTVKGSTIRVELNGTVIVDGDVAKVTAFEAKKGRAAHPGLDRTKGFFGFAGHNDPVQFRNISIRTLE